MGPAGSQFGLLACLIVEVLNCWPMLKRPEQALSKLLAITFLLFLLGLLPWVDNFAHLFGFIFGFLLSYALLPFVSFGPYDRQKKIFLIWVCLLSALFLFLLLLLLFYLIPMYDCEICSYFNCIPITKDFCANQNINFKKDDYTVWQMWWRRCKTAHTLVTTFETFANCFVTLATSCKILEVLVNIYASFLIIKRRGIEQNKIIIIIKKITYSVLCYCEKKPFNKIKLYYCFLWYYLL